MIESITVNEVVEFLNHLLTIDRKTITSLIKHKIECNKNLFKHPSVQVLKTKDKYLVSMLGILNGMFGVDNNGYGQITACFENDIIIKFVKTSEIKK